MTVESENSDEIIYRELAKLGVNVNALREAHLSHKSLGDFLAGMLKLHGKKIRPETPDRVETVEDRDHIIAVYPDVHSKLDEAFSFLREGLERNDAILFLTDEMTRDDILKRMSRDWNVDTYELERNGDITVRSTKTWYFPGGKFDSSAVIEKWRLFAKVAEARGKTGVHLFADTSSFFQHGFSKELVEYEAMLRSKFDIPMTAICSYTANDVKMLTPNQVDMLYSCHKAPIWC